VGLDGLWGGGGGGGAGDNQKCARNNQFLEKDSNLEPPNKEQPY